MRSPEKFLATHWQKRPLMMRDAVEFHGPVLSADEAAWLATQADVESRLVFTDRSGGEQIFRLEQGPFSESDLSDLPTEDWTLLIQDVEKHLPEFRQWFDAIDFIPDWRIDDLMISVAAPGGSVGPHADNYDVFLVQVSGTRDWITGPRDSAEPDQSAEGLSLLQPFEAEHRWNARPGDVLYLPPGVPHWGVAKTLCTTYSIGMRAPTQHELVAGADRVLDKPSGESDSDDRFYEDPDLSPFESAAGEISAEALDRLAAQALLPDDLTANDRARVLGNVVTDPKAWLMPEPASDGDAPERIHGMAQLAWAVIEGTSRVFVNGADRAVEPDQLTVFQRWCDSRVITTAEIDALHGTGNGAEYVEWLRLQGAFDAGHSDE